MGVNIIKAHNMPQESNSIFWNYSEVKQYICKIITFIFWAYLATDMFRFRGNIIDALSL